MKVITTFNLGRGWFEKEVEWDTMGLTIFESLVTEAIDSTQPFEYFAVELFQIDERIVRYLEKKTFDMGFAFNQERFEELKEDGFFEIEPSAQEALEAYVICGKFYDILVKELDSPAFISVVLYTLRDGLDDETLVHSYLIVDTETTKGWAVVVDVDRLLELTKNEEA